MYQDQTGGLEVLNEAGQWIPVDPIPGAYVINIGDLLSLWTGYRWKSTCHRVRQTGMKRYSIPFFLEPAFDSVIEPLVRAKSQNGNQIVYGPWLIDKITREFVEYASLLQ